MVWIHWILELKGYFSNLGIVQHRIIKVLSVLKKELIKQQEVIHIKMNIHVGF